MNSEVKGDCRFPLLEVPPAIVTQRRWYLNHKDQYPSDAWESVYYLYYFLNSTINIIPRNISVLRICQSSKAHWE